MPLILFGEENPTRDEQSYTWGEWKDGNGDPASVHGDASYGALILNGSDVLVSNVIDTMTDGGKALRLSLNVYGSGEGSPGLWIRGSQSSFNYDDASPEWEVYSQGMKRLWRYLQVRTSCILPGWSYRKAIPFSRAAGAVTNYQIKLTVYRSSGTDAAGVVYIGTKCKEDYSDLRFTTADGTTLLDYCIETSSAASAVVWVELDSVGTSETTFYMYYGNADAESLSNGANTFIAFDDFERGSNGDAVGGIWSSAGVTISTDHAFNGTRCAKIAGSASYNCLYTTVTAVTKENSIGIRLWKENAAKNDILYCNGTKRMHVYLDTSENIKWISTTTRDSGYNLTADAWQLFEFNDFDWSSYTFDCTYNTTKVIDNGNMQTSAALANKFYIEDCASGSGNDTYIDCFYVRNWRSGELTWGTWGSEEEL